MAFIGVTASNGPSLQPTAKWIYCSLDRRPKAAAFIDVLTELNFFQKGILIIYILPVCYPDILI